jgi:membrane-bound lytic murein transglycosylase B
VVTLTMAACLLASCTATEPSDRETTPGAPAATAQPDEPVEVLPELPVMDDAATLADQLDRAAETLRGRDAGESDVRRAAEFHQLAVRALATAPASFRRRVMDRLPRRTARVTRGDVRAATLLGSMTEPQQRLPRWRIVAPPPATVLLDHYERAQRRTGVPWTYLAAIHLVETRMGRIRGTSSAGAQGPMQFLPSTWERYGAGGDINDPRDAILAAGRLLQDHGAPGDMAGALWHYNPSESYVGAVLEYARTMQRSAAAYRGYWHWRVLYRHTRGTYVLPVGYPEERAVLLPDSSAASRPPARGTVPPDWLGTRTLARTADGYGEVRPTPRVMRVRRWNARDSIPALPGTGFKAIVTDPAPERVIARSTWQPGCPVSKEDLAWIRVTYWGFDDARHSGEMLVNGSVAGDVVRVFRQLYRARFPIEAMGIARLEDLDVPPTGDGNVTGSFACRPIRGGTGFSQHAHGLAVDLNPFQNPYHRGDVVLPELASAYLDRGWLRPGMIAPEGPAVRAFAAIGWEWGGDWSSLKDYHHFSLNGR